MAAVRTTCPYCGVGCGVLATPDGRGGATIAGDPEHPANFGRLCSKGSALGETLDLDGRLLAPRIGGIDSDWDSALDLVADKFRAAIRDHGPDSVAIYGSGQLLTEDYYVANKLMKGFVGSANIDTNSRLCMASSVAGQRRAFGADTVPGTYEDLELADLVVLVGSNLAWCHPVLYQRIAAAKAARPAMRVVAIDPRRTATCDLADLHLGIAADTDVALFNGLLRAIEAGGAIAEDYVARHVSGLPEALAGVDGCDIASVAALTGVAVDDLAEFYRRWVGTERVVTVFSQGVNQSTSGTGKVCAIINCHLATGRIGRPGMGPFSVTGQPNAMGGREVGGLANMLAAHLDLEDPGHRALVRGFWQAPNLAQHAGPKAVDLFRACGDGRIRALWILSTNPVVSMPEADAVAAAIGACDFVVVSEMNAGTDTARLADVLLPAAGWGEKSGTVTNSERRISRQRTFLPEPGLARPDWWALSQVAARLGWGAQFAYSGPADIFREHAALSALAGTDFDIGALSLLSDQAYADLAPVQWPVGRPARFFGDGGFFTPDRKGRVVAVAQPPLPPVDPAHPLVLNTGRVRDQWHTMTRSGKSPRLSQHFAEPFVEMNPEDAAARGIAAADLVALASPTGGLLVRALVSDRVARGTVFVPMHWNAEWSGAARVDSLVPAATDPHSGQPALKAGRVQAAKYAPAWHGYAVSRAEPRPACAYWARARIRGGWRLELAGDRVPEDWLAFARELFDAPGAQAVSTLDAGRGLARIALVHRGRVIAVLFAAPEPVDVARAHVVTLLAEDAPAAALLAGRPGAGRPDAGAAVCACFDVGVNTIVAAIASGVVASVEDIGRSLRAGSNCGSCRPELRALLAATAPRIAAE